MGFTSRKMWLMMLCRLVPYPDMDDDAQFCSRWDRDCPVISKAWITWQDSIRSCPEHSPQYTHVMVAFAQSNAAAK